MRRKSLERNCRRKRGGRKGLCLIERCDTWHCVLYFSNLVVQLIVYAHHCILKCISLSLYPPSLSRVQHERKEACHRALEKSREVRERQTQMYARLQPIIPGKRKEKEGEGGRKTGRTEVAARERNMVGSVHIHEWIRRLMDIAT